MSDFEDDLYQWMMDGDEETDADPLEFHTDAEIGEAVCRYYAKHITRWLESHYDISPKPQGHRRCEKTK